jgi:hypothetical protein
VSADRSKGDQWMRAATRRRGRIEPEKITREATVGERMSSAVRAAAGRALRVSPPADTDAGQ